MYVTHILKLIIGAIFEKKIISNYDSPFFKFYSLVELLQWLNETVLYTSVQLILDALTMPLLSQIHQQIIQMHLLLIVHQAF
jgi:hypothetical protein